MDSKITLIEKTPYNFLKDIFDANYTRDKNNEKNVGLLFFTCALTTFNNR